MLSTAPLIESAFDLKRIEREVQQAHIALRDAETASETSERKATTDREEAARRRVELGRALIEARRGCKHGEWLPLLERCGIQERTARRWMELAGWVESKSDTDGDVSDLPAAPTLRDAGIDKRPRKSEQSRAASNELPPQSPNEEETVPLPRATDLDRALVSIHKTMMGYAKTWPRRSRIELAKTLRSLASEIEGMTDEAE